MPVMLMYAAVFVGLLGAADIIAGGGLLTFSLYEFIRCIFTRKP